MATCLLIAPAPDPTRVLTGAIESLFVKMEEAVLAGDQEGYLALIDHADPVFVQEHVNWAKDLARGLPAAFDMALESEPMIRTSPDGPAEVRAMVEMRYTPGATEEGQNHEPRVIRYRARFTPLFDCLNIDGSLQSGGTWVVNGAPLAEPLLYGGEAWDILEHGTTRVMFPRQYREAAQIVVDALPPIREHVDMQMGSDNSEHIQVVKLYGDMEHLQASIYLSYVQGLSGWNEPGESIKLMARNGGGPRSMDGLLAHEYGHAATFWMGESANAMPWWTLEGIADYVSRAYRADYGDAEADPAREREIPEQLAATLKAWGEQDRLPAWSDLTDFYTVDPRWMGNVYTQGYHMIAYITQHFGVSARNEWLRTMAAGSSIDEATKAVLSRDFATLDEQWRATLKPEVAPAVEAP